MAISKLMHMKETAGNPSRHLKTAIIEYYSICHLLV